MAVIVFADTSELTRIVITEGKPKKKNESSA